MLGQSPVRSGALRRAQARAIRTRAVPHRRGPPSCRSPLSDPEAQPFCLCVIGKVSNFALTLPRRQVLVEWKGTASVSCGRSPSFIEKLSGPAQTRFKLNRGGLRSPPRRQSYWRAFITLFTASHSRCRGAFITLFTTGHLNSPFSL